MLNEYKRPMWNDGFAKEQPWLNYFNEYECTHCCFGDAADDTNGSELSDKDFEDYEGIGGKGSHAAAEAEAAAAAAAAAADQAATDQQTAMDTGEGGRSASSHAAAVAEAEGRSVAGIEGYEDLGLLDEDDLSALGYEEAVEMQEKASDKADVAELQEAYDKKGLDVDISIGPDGTWSYEGPDAWKAAGTEMGKGLHDLVGNIGYGIGGLATAAMNLSPFGLARNLAGYHTPALHPDFDIGPGIEASLKGIAGDFSTKMGGTPEKSQTTAALGGLDSLVDPKEKHGLEALFEDRSYLNREIEEERSRMGKPSLSAGAGIGEQKPSVGVVGESAPRSSLDAQIAADYTKGIGRGDAVTQSKLGLSPAYEQELQRREMERDVNINFMTKEDMLHAALVREIEEERKAANIYKDDRWKDWHGLHLATGGQVGNFDTVYPLPSPTPPPPPPPEEEEKTKSAMELYLEKLGQPSKYTVPTVPMDTPSMDPPPTGSDPFELAEYRKGLARETMGNYLPFDVGGASGALNTFNEDYYGGASNVSPYNMAQLASLLGLRGPGSYEGIIGMLGGVRNEPPPTPEPEPEPELPVTPDDPYDDEGGPDNPDDPNLDWAAHGGGIGRVLRRQAGGAAQAMMADPNYRRVRNPNLPPRPPRHPGIGQSPPRGPDGEMSILPWPEPPIIEPPWPPIVEPPPPPPTYDPVREEAARKRARELQAFKIGELDETPQTTAERLALEESGGMYRDEHGEIRDASGAVQEDWGFDYTPPPELDKKYDPPNTPDTPPPVDPEDPDEPKTGNGFPLPPDVIDPLPQPPNSFPKDWRPDDRIYSPHDPRIGNPYLPDMGKPNPYVGIGSLNHPLGSPGEPYLPMMNYGGGHNIGPQQLPTGLQGLQQGFGMQNPNYIPPSTRPVSMGQNMQGFGMQSPRPFGTPAFSSGFGGFGQQQGYNR